MKITQHSYRYAVEILQHEHYRNAWNEIYEVISNAPLFIYPGKSKKNSKLEIVQQMINVYFDRKLAVELGWEWHPLATKITNSGLAADFRKTFAAVPRPEDIDPITGEILREYPPLTIQAEVQFGNASRWYSDIFKFQTAYSQSLTNVGICVLPMGNVARKIDSNVASYERSLKELPSAELSITLPIVLFGLEPDNRTPVYDLSTTRFKTLKEITGKGNGENMWRIINAVCLGQDISTVGPDSPTGPMFDLNLAADPDAVLDPE